jgi:hypothetical protein
MKRFLVVAGRGFHHQMNFDDGKLGLIILDETNFKGRETECREILELRVGESARTPHPLNVFESIMRLPDQEDAPL